MECIFVGTTHMYRNCLSIQHLSLLSLLNIPPLSRIQATTYSSQTTRDCRQPFPYNGTSQPTGSHSPDHTYKLCWLTNCTAGRPAWPPDKSQPAQASDRIPLLTKRSKHSQLAKGVLTGQSQLIHEIAASRTPSPTGLTSETATDRAAICPVLCHASPLCISTGIHIHSLAADRTKPLEETSSRCKLNQGFLAQHVNAQLYN
jgi:hypothetical protein